MNLTWIIVALAIGAILGTFYFGGLWITVRRVVIVQQPALLLLVSFLVRAGVVLLGFYFVTDGRWERLIACMGGFLLARSFWIRRLRQGGQDSRLCFKTRTMAVRSRRNSQRSSEPNYRQARGTFRALSDITTRTMR